jgi:hypothetical protein
MEQGADKRRNGSGATDFDLAFVIPHQEEQPDREHDDRH